MIAFLEAASERIGKAAMFMSCALIVYMTGHILLEIVLRTFFASSTYSMDEFVGYALCGMTFFAMSETFRQRRHIRVNVLFTLVNDRARWIIELICLALTFAVMAFLAQYIWRILVRDFTRGAVSPSIMATPVWIVDTVIFTGLCLLLLQIACSMLSTLVHGVAPDHSEGSD